MCGRFLLASSDDLLDGAFGPRAWPAREPRYNISPTQPVLSLSMGIMEPRWLNWGLVPRWARDASPASGMINARSETVFSKPSFRGLLKGNRCLVPATGFYEWQAGPGGMKRPFLFRRADGRPFAFAGLWDSWQAPGGTNLLTCAILTMEAPDWMRQWHHRSPVMLTGESASAWLGTNPMDEAGLRKVVVSWTREEMVAVPVSNRVNSPGREGPECAAPLEPDEPSPRPFQRGLFD